MKSSCAVILPLNIKNEDVKDFIENQIRRYNINYNGNADEYDIEDYMDYDIDDEYFEYIKKHGNISKDDYMEIMQEQYSNGGDKIQKDKNGRLYAIVDSPINCWRWDYYIFQDTIKNFSEIEFGEIYSLVTLDGKWHSMRDYDYRPILDFKNYYELKINKIHQDNIEPLEEWRLFFEPLQIEFADYRCAVISVHS